MFLGWGERSQSHHCQDSLKKGMVFVEGKAGWTWGDLHTVDGSEIRRLPVDMVVVFFPLFTGFYTFSVVQDFFHQPYVGHPYFSVFFSWPCFHLALGKKSSTLEIGISPGWLSWSFGSLIMLHLGVCEQKVGLKSFDPHDLWRFFATSLGFNTLRWSKVAIEPPSLGDAHGGSGLQT